MKFINHLILLGINREKQLMQFELKNGCSWTLYQKRHKINSRSFLSVRCIYELNPPYT